MIYAAIIGLSITLIAVVLMAVNDKSIEWFTTGIVAGFMIVSLIFLINSLVEVPSPTPIDVYRGRTTLQITYQEGVPIDTAVVFKEGYREETK